MIQYVRSFIFNIVFFVWMIFVSIACLIASVFWGYKGINRVGEMCSFMVEHFLRFIVGVTTEFRGQEHIPTDGKFLVACKHQSAWETISLHRFVKDPTVVMKKELSKWPLFGKVVVQAGSILIDRKKGKEVLPQMIEGTTKSLKIGRPVFIFPEGTRSTPGKPGRYRHGIFALYDALKVPVLPIALNSGYFWPKRGFLKKKGHIVMERLPVIQPGLKEKDFMKKLERVIEDASLKIAPQETTCPQKKALL